jgi:hypothetical protein
VPIVATGGYTWRVSRFRAAVDSPSSVRDWSSVRAAIASIERNENKFSTSPTTSVNPSFSIIIGCIIHQKREGKCFLPSKFIPKSSVMISSMDYGTEANFAKEILRTRSK